jgi:hypothetical protein
MSGSIKVSPRPGHRPSRAGRRGRGTAAVRLQELAPQDHEACPQSQRDQAEDDPPAVLAIGETSAAAGRRPIGRGAVAGGWCWGRHGAAILQSHLPFGAVTRLKNCGAGRRLVNRPRGYTAGLDGSETKGLHGGG